MNWLKQKLRDWLEIENYNDTALRDLVSGELHHLDKKIDPLYDIGAAIPQNSTIEFILGSIAAFEKRLGQVEWYWEDDPNYFPEQPRQRRAWRIKS